jgi:serine phosphatase RsbU (regulator of sigma subunit)
MAHVELVAAATQQALLTQVPARVGDFEVATSYASADEDARVGGDLYEVMATPWGVRALIGDVRGKGLDAVGLAARVLGTFRATAGSRRLGADVLDDLDRAVELAAGPEDFVTAVLVEIAGDELTCWTAGHPPPLLLRDGVATALVPEVPQPPLGMSPSPAPHTVRVQAEDLLLLYTDGLIEARHPSSREFFPLEDAALRLLHKGDLAAGLGDLAAEVRAWTGGLSDDVAMVLLSPSPPGDKRWVRRR